MAIIQCKVDRKDWYEVYIEYSVSQDAIKAQSTITHALKIKQLTNGYDFESYFPITYQIGSETFSHSGYVNMNDVGDAGYTITLASGKTVIQHNTTTGVGSFYVACSGLADAGGWGPGNVTLDGKYESLTTIDRKAPTITLSTSSVTSSSVIISATSNETADVWDYSLDNGSTWTRMSTTAGKSATKTVTDLSPNTTYNIKVRARRKSNEVYGTSTVRNITTLGNTNLNSVKTLIIDDANPVLTMNWTVYTAYTHKLEIKDGSTTVLTIEDLTSSGVGTINKAITLTEVQRGKILKYMKDTRGFIATFCLTTLNGSVQIGNATTATATITTTSENSAPEFTVFTHFDDNGNTNDITNDSQLYIKGHSSLNIEVADGAAKNYATISSYRVTVGSDVKSFDSPSIWYGSIGVSGENVSLIVEVIDSRGYSTKITKTIEVIDYADVYITSYSIRRKNEVEPTVQLSFSGDISPIVVEGEARNEVVSSQFRYSPNGGDWSDWYDMEVDDNTRSFEFTTSALSYNEDEVVEFDPNSQYYLEVRVEDRLSEDIVPLFLNKGIPLVAYRSKKVGINEPNPQAALHVRGENPLMLNDKTILDFVHPVGSYYWSSVSTDPAELFGGTWEQVKDKFVLAAGDTYEAGSTGGSATHTLTIDEMPSHYHEIPWDKAGNQGYRGVNTYTDSAGFNGNSQYFTEHKGGSKPHNNMPPYEVAYCWKRIE